jgi:hypothetical protein
VVSPQAVAVVPWYQARWVGITGAVLWWLLTFAWGLAKAMVIVMLAIIGVVLMIVVVLTHFVGGPRG